MPSEPIDAAEVLARHLRATVPSASEQRCLAGGKQVLAALSERAGGGGFAVLPDGDKWVLYRVESGFPTKTGSRVLVELVPIVGGDE